MDTNTQEPEMDTNAQELELNSAVTVPTSPPLGQIEKGKRPAEAEWDDNHNKRTVNIRKYANRVFAHSNISTQNAIVALREKDLLSQLEEATARIEMTLADAEKTTIELQALQEKTAGMLAEQEKVTNELLAEQKKTSTLTEGNAKLQSELDRVYNGIRESNINTRRLGAARNKRFEDTIAEANEATRRERERADANNQAHEQLKVNFDRSYRELDTNNTELYKAHQELLANGGREGYITEKLAHDMVDEAKREVILSMHTQHTREVEMQVKAQRLAARAEALAEAKEEAEMQIKTARDSAVAETMQLADRIYHEEQLKNMSRLAEAERAKEAAEKQVYDLQKQLADAGTKTVEVPVEVIVEKEVLVEKAVETVVEKIVEKVVEKVVYIDRPTPEMVCTSTQTIDPPSPRPLTITIGGVQEIPAMVCTSTQTIDPPSSQPLTVTIGGVQETPDVPPQNDGRLAGLTALLQTEVSELQELLTESNERVASAEEFATQLADNHGQAMELFHSVRKADVERLEGRLAAAEDPMNRLRVEKSTVLKNYFDTYEAPLPVNEEEYPLSEAGDVVLSAAELKEEIREEVEAHYQWLMDFKYGLLTDNSQPPPNMEIYRELLESKDEVLKQQGLVADGLVAIKTLEEDLEASREREAEEKKRSEHLAKNQDEKLKGFLQTLGVGIATVIYSAFTTKVFGLW
ncbi:hypothetical protein BJ875DRAFT_523902 [Amylocarpus encephaloides]|uniref:Uncharacterized protein n=1 Tax=Amylocarpus encephaloides TaxID=45428 RepID=A0A9P7YNF4_9HELO|nr:hypothetical protein BJ875DRAFT_523902 [Amylocarpus encephaloides]